MVLTEHIAMNIYKNLRANMPDYVFEWPSVTINSVVKAAKPSATGTVYIFIRDDKIFMVMTAGTSEVTDHASIDYNDPDFLTKIEGAIHDWLK